MAMTNDKINKTKILRVCDNQQIKRGLGFRPTIVGYYLLFLLSGQYWIGGLLIILLLFPSV